MNPKSPTMLTAPKSPDLQEMPEIAERIMWVAIGLFARKGYSATSVREIVRDARVTNPMLYYYFESKEGLFCKIIDNLMEYRYEQLSRIEATNQSLRDKLREFMRFSVDSALESPDVLRFIYSAILGPQEGRPKYDLYAHHQKTTELVVRMFDNAVDAGEFKARADMNTTFLADFLLQSIGMFLMRGLRLTDDLPESERETALQDFGSESSIERFLDLYFGGAGVITEGTIQ